MIIDKIIKQMDEYKDETINLIEALCKIPSPSHHEQEKATFIKGWLESKKAKGAYIDEAYNVLYPFNCKDASEIIVFMAHIDTVFPDLSPLPFNKDDKYLYSPGVGDDTTCVAMLLMVVSLIIKENLSSKTRFINKSSFNIKRLSNVMGD